MDWFWIIYGGGLGIAAILFWISEFSGMKLGGKKKSKSMWQKSKDRIHKRQYGADTHYSTGRTHHIKRKGM